MTSVEGCVFFTVDQDQLLERTIQTELGGGSKAPRMRDRANKIRFTPDPAAVFAAR